MESFESAGGPVLLRINDACRCIGLGRSKLYELIARGDIEIVKIGSRTLVPLASLQKFVHTLPSTRPAGGLSRGG